MKRSTKHAKATNEPLTPADIRRIREGLGLNQVEAGELLGGGIRAFQKYESGAITPAATTVNLLRILEADPSALGALTGTHVPIQQTGLRPFEISGAHVTALSPPYLVALTRRLLSAEATTNRIAPDRIHVASNLTAPDGGEDARITWEGDPERTPFLPSRNCLLQVKAASITPQRAAKDVLTTAGALEPAIRETLEAGGNYLMLCNRAYTGRQVLDRETAVRQAVRDQGVAIKTGQIAFRDADQIAAWVNEHPQVATWVQEQTQPGLATSLRSWTHWAGRHEHETPFIDDARLSAVREGIRPATEREREVVRVVGLSGLGKSRLVLEALAPDQETGIRTSDLVLYGVETELGPTTVKGAVQFLADLGRRAIVVIDRCGEETHVDLAAMVRRSSSRLSLITIDHEVPGGKLPVDMVLVDSADDAVVEALVKNLKPGLPSEDVRRLVNFAKGYPQMAVLSAEAWVADVSLATVTKEFLIDQVVVGRRAANRQELLQSAKVVSTFGLIGFRDEADVELTEAANLIGGITADQLRTNLVDLVRRRVAQPRGRFLAIQPRPIAHSLAERQWEEWSQDVWDRILTAAPANLRVRAARQLALLNRSEIAAKVAKHVTRCGGPLDSFEAVSDPANAGVIDYLSQIDARSTGDLLERVFDALPPGDLSNFSGDARSEIRWAAQRIAYLPDTFELGARLLRSLALAENEEWANNCTGQFKALFPAYLADTAADGAARLRFLDDMIEADNPQAAELLVGALEKGAETQQFSRSLGIESHGLRPVQQPWNPSYNEAIAYINECLDRLLRFALRDDATGARSKLIIGQHFRALIGHGFIDFAERAVAELAQAQGAYWPEALSSIGDAITYDGAGQPEALVARVRALLDAVSPSDLAGRLKLIVTEMPWDYPSDVQLDFDERGKRQRAAVYEIAKEALAEPAVLEVALPELSVGQQRTANIFGEALAEHGDDPVAWLWRIMTAYRAGGDQANPDLLTSYLAALARTKPRLVATFKRRAIRAPSLARTFPPLSFKMDIPSADILMARDALRDGTLKANDLYAWSFGGRLALREPGEVAPLLDQIFASEEDANFGYDLLGMYVHGRRERLEQLRPQLRLVAETALAGASNTMNDHHFTELMMWLLNKGRDDADARSVALMLTRKLIERIDDGSLIEERRIRPLLPLLLRLFPEIVWPLIGNAITSEPKAAWRFQFALGKGHSFGINREMPPLLELSEDTLFSWCHAHPEVAPAFLATTLPMLTTDEPGDGGASFMPIVRRLIDEFGERDDVQKALVANMYTFGWSGSMTTYYELYKEPLAHLHNHAKSSVRKWAKRMSDQIEREIAREQDSDEEHEAQYD